MNGLSETKVTHFDSIEDLEAFLETSGSVPIGEPGLVELDHSLQCAAELEAVAPHDVELQIAGLVHDVCHGQCHIRTHDIVGAEAVRGLLGHRIAELIRLHVTAKRYLITTDPAYGDILSPVSTGTLALQGGVMTPEEVAEFEAHPFARDAIVLRKADDAAKVPGRVVPGLDHWRKRLRQVASAQV